MTSCCGMEPLRSEGTYPTYIACNLFTDTDVTYIPWSGWMDDRFPKITQEGGDIIPKDRMEAPICSEPIVEDHGSWRSINYAYIANMRDSATAGFKYFDCRNVKEMSVCTKGYATGKLEVRTKWDGEVIGSFEIGYANEWHETKADIEIPDGVHDLFFTFKGTGHLQFAAFSFC